MWAIISPVRRHEGADAEAGETVIRARRLGKCYHVYDRPADRLKQGLWGWRKSYFREFWALRELTFSVARGETLGVIGRNGSGKSTLLQLVAGTLAPTTGDIDVRGRVAALLELGSGFNPEFTGRENVFMNAAVLGLSPDEAAARFHDIVAFAGIGDFLDRPVKTYSTGMVLRLAFAVAIHVDADILIIDEALAVGDAGFQFQCLERLTQLARAGTTLLLVTHDMTLVKTFCHRVLYLKDGQERASGSAEDMTEFYFLDTWQAQPGSQTASTTIRRKPSLRGSDGIAFGTEQGRIVGAAFASTGGAHAAVHTGDFVEFDVDVEFVKTVARPHLSVTVQDSRLLIVGGRSFALPAVQSGDDGTRVARVRCVFLARLGAGAFFVSLRLEDRQSERLFLPIDKQVAVLRLDIVPSVTDAFFGAVDLDLRLTPHDAPGATAQSLARGAEV
jgi:lipopolysaccharide transport system ATP-binding protein